VASVLAYNGLAIVHFLAGGVGFALGYPFWVGYLLGSACLLSALVEMYAIMPLKVCPNCPYYRMGNSRCVSGLNVLSRGLARKGDVKDFSNRARGLLCPNNLYLAGLVLPIIGLVPALVISFGYAVLALLVAIVAMLAIRFFIIFPRVACGHCRARSICPNARSMGLGGR
jgi:hypothetical protein